ncbi:MAG: oligosaccharide flippase family protein [Acidobacteria bacterium]|nr:oligosaccharide flippase family protein [Acidobacteriota bacterium]
MISEAQTTVRNVGLLLAQRGVNLTGGMLMALLLPRLMGPQIFGRYALITSLAMWFVIFSSLSSAQVMSRFIPPLVLAKDRSGIEKFLGNLLAARLSNGLLAAVTYLLFTALWFGELDTLMLVFVALSICLQTSSKLLFAFFLGLNQAARWGMGEILRQWLSLMFLVPGFYFGGLRGAGLGLMLAELLTLVVGMVWAAPYLSWSNLRFDFQYLSPYLRFSLSFFASNLLLTISLLSGELLVRVASGDYAQVGYFGLAYKAYLVAGQALWQPTMAFAPLLSSLLAQGNSAEIKRWVERLLKWMAVLGVVATFGALLLARDLVPLVFGAAYLPVADNVWPLMLALLALALSSVARLLALTYNKPGIAGQAAVLQIVSFWGVGLPLIAWQGSFAGCLAVLLAGAWYGGYFTFRMRRVVGYSLRHWVAVILPGALFLPLVWLRSSWQVNVALFAVFIIGYVGLLLALRIVTAGELTRMRRALRPEVLALEESPN